MVNVQQKQFGKNGPKVSVEGYGSMGLSIAYGQGVDFEESARILSKCVEDGVTHIDCSNIYGDAEDKLGEWFSKNEGMRKKVFLATKFGIVRKGMEMSVRGDREHVLESCDTSLKRLKTDYIDLYYAHRIDKNIPIEETMEALVELKNAGKIKYIGLSECSSDTLRRACAVHQVQAVQVEFSPFALDIETDEIGILKTARELGVAIVPYSPLGRGLMTGQLKSPKDFEEGDFRKFSPRFSEENFPKNLKLVHQLEEHAKKKGCTVGQLTLAWIMAQGDDFFPIPGTKKMKYLEENIGACDVKLTKEEIADIRKEVDSAVPAGNRYPEGMQSTLFGDSAPKKS